MNKPKIRLAVLIVIGVAAVITGAILYQNYRSTGTEDTTVAVMLPLTGDLAFLGEPGKIAVQMAEKELRASGKPIQFVIVDTKGSPSETVSAMRAEKDIRGRRLFMVTLSGPSLAAREAFADEDVALVAIAIHPELAQENRHLTQFCLSAKQEAEMLASKIVKSSGKLGIIASRDAATTSEVERFLLPELSRAGRDPAFVEWFDVGNRDFHNLTARLRSTRPNELLVLGYGSDFPAIFDAVSVAGKTDDLTVYGGIGFVELEKRPTGFPKAKFQVAVPAFAVETANPRTQKFRKDYEAVAKRPASYDAAFTYDAVMVLGDLISRGKRTPQDIRESLRGMKYQGVAGTTDIGRDGSASTEMRWATFGASSLTALAD